MKGKERGAIIVEATIGLTSFIFFIYILLTVVNVCLAQAKIGIAVNAAAKELSQYCYLYSLTGVEKMAAVAEEKGGLSDDVVDDVAAGIETIYDEIGNISKGNSSASSVKNSAKSAYNSIKSGATTVADDPKEFILSAIYATGEDLFEMGKNSVGAALVKNLVKKNLRTHTEGTSLDSSVENFLRYCRVVPSGNSYMDGIDFGNTEVMPQGAENNLIIKIVAEYEISFVRLLNMDLTVNLCACGKTQAWAVGETPESKSFGSSSGSGDDKTEETTEETTKPETSTEESTTEKKKTAKDYAKESTANPNSQEVYIGSNARKMGDSNNGTYLWIEDKNRLEEELGTGGSWQVQKEFMQSQIDKKKTFFLTDDPNTASGDYANQIKYLKNHDYEIVEMPIGSVGWKAVPKSSLNS